MSVLEFDCSFSYPSFEYQLQFQAKHGVTALFGPSGSGKSTTLALIAGLLNPKHGRISLNGKPLVDTSSRVCLPPNRRNIGIVFQDQLLFPHLSVEQNLRYGQRRQKEQRISLERLANLLEIEELLPRYPQTLSGGQQQRVAIGRAVLSNPEMLLLDEPFAGLDDPLKAKIIGCLEQVVEEFSIPMLLVSHNQTLVRRLASEVVVVERGKLVVQGETSVAFDELLCKSNSQGVQVLNVLPITQVQQTGGAWHARLGTQILHLPATADASVRYVRFLPHDVSLASPSTTPLKLSVRNQLHGEVTNVHQQAETVFVAIHVGQQIWAEITPAALRDLELRVGSQVICLLKTSALSLLP